MTPKISEIWFTPAPERLHAAGIVGWVSFLIDDAIRVDGVAVRKSRHGSYLLAYPLREDALGVHHYALRPINSAARRMIEARVLGELGFDYEEAL